MAPSASLFDLIDSTEGGGRYDTLYGHSQRPGGQYAGTDPSNMSLDELDTFGKEYGPWVRGQLANSGQRARIATPSGRYQIVGATRRRLAKDMGLSGDTKFTPEVQDRMARRLAMDRINGSDTVEGRRAGMRAEWEGFKNVPDDVLDRAITDYQRTGGATGPTINTDGSISRPGSSGGAGLAQIKPDGSIGTPRAPNRAGATTSAGLNEKANASSPDREDRRSKRVQRAGKALWQVGSDILDEDREPW